MDKARFFRILIRNSSNHGNFVEKDGAINFFIAVKRSDSDNKQISKCFLEKGMFVRIITTCKLKYLDTIEKSALQTTEILIEKHFSTFLDLKRNSTN